MVNVAMMVVEGLGRKLDTDLVPTLEARPILEMALGLRAEAPRLVPQAAPPPEEPEPAPPVAATATATVETDRPFVGRGEELRRIAAALDGAAGGRGRLLLLAGEPGIGKTRTTEQAIAIAESRGLRTLVARCHEGEGAPAYWPWVQAVRAYAEAVEPQSLEAHLGAAAADVVQIVPELRERLRDVAAPPPLDAEQARFRLFDGFVGFLKRASENRPLLLVLDDLHWADKPTLLLLLFVTREIADSRIAVIGTYRETEVRAGHPLADVLPSLRRERVFERVLLRGLHEEDVRTLVAALSGGAAPGALTATIARETEGNPLFVEEMVRQITEENRGRRRSAALRDDVGLPASIREAIDRRLSRLEPSCRELLAIASVVGRSFDVELLARLGEVNAERLGDELDQALGARILEEERGDPGRMRFSHGLIREALYESVPAGERARRHDEIGRALESLPVRSGSRRLAELAYHFAAAAGRADLGQALDYAIRAGDEALGRIAHEEAAEHYQRALALLDTHLDADATRRCELLLKLGEAQSLSMPTEIFHATFREAARIAESIGSAELFARAVFGYGGPFAAFGIGRVDRTLLDLCERALGMLPDEDGAVRAQLLARLAEELNFSAEDVRRETLAREAIAMARRLGDRRVLAEVLVRCQLATARPDNVEERLAMVEEIIRLSLDAEDLWLEQQARAWAFTHRLEIGDADGARRELEACERAVRRSPTPLGHTWARASASMLALMEGRIEEAGRLTAEVAAMAERGGAWSAGILVAASQSSLVQLVREGMSSDQIERLRVLIEHFPGLRNMKAAMAMLYAFQGHEEGARRELERAWPERLDELRRDAVWLPAVLSLVEAVVLLRDEKRAAVLYEALAPFEAHCVVVPLGMCFGSTSRLLGGLAGVLHRYELAEQHFERSLALHRRIAATLWAGLTCFDWARMLLHRDLPSDRPRALALAEQTLEYSHRMGVSGPLLDRVHALLNEARARQSEPASDDPPAAEPAAPPPVVSAPPPPPEPSPSVSHGTVTLLFSDIEGLTELTEKLGDAQALALLQAHDVILRRVLPDHDGREVDAQRDGFLFAFTRSTDALRFARAAQAAVARYRADHPEHPLHVRMGIHAGEPIREKGRFFGRTVILTSRIAARARGDEIRVSAVVRALAESDPDLVFDAGEDVELKGLAGRHRIYCLLHDSVARAPQPPSSPIEAVAEAAPAEPLFRREGDYWTVRFDARTSRMKDSKGMRYLARLLERPGEDIHVVDLLDERAHEPDGPRTAGTDATEVGLGDAGDVLDAQARGEYRRRLDDLAAELEEARRFNDAGRIESLEHEIAFLTRELSAAFGLGGRARKAGNVAERARKAVSNRIRVTIERITAQHEPLGKHLTIAVRLGTYCCYTPEQPVRWSF